MLGTWYLRVRIPGEQWRRPYEAGRESMARGHFDEAERQFAIAVEAARWLGPDDPRLALSLVQQAEALVAGRRFVQSLPLLERALEIDAKVLGPDHPDLAPVWDHYAVPLRQVGRIAQAEVAEDRARVIRIRSGRHPGGHGGPPR
jgi:tetratricopeptide (TPR) repeat protein